MTTAETCVSESRVTTCVFPSKYIQGPGALGRLPGIVSSLGGRALVVCGGAASCAVVDHFVRPQLSDAMYTQLAGTPPEATRAEVDRLAALARTCTATLIIAVGGGKVIDSAKAAASADGLSLHVVVCPTVASSDAPCSALSVLYTDTGEVSEVLQLRNNPDVVLVDTRVLCMAPVRYLVAGIGDALSTWFESESCRQRAAPNCAGAASDRGSFTAYALSRLCYDTIREFGELAVIANKAHVAVDAFERVVEANTLLSGVGFESAGLAAAHSIHDGLTVLPETRRFLHGEKVAIGVQASLFLTEKSSAQINEVFAFCESVSLPTTLADIGLEHPTRELLQPVAAKAVRSGSRIHHEPHRISAEAVVDALLMADSYGRDRRRK